MQQRRQRDGDGKVDHIHRQAGEGQAAVEADANVRAGDIDLDLLEVQSGPNDWWTGMAIEVAPLNWMESVPPRS